MVIWSNREDWELQLLIDSMRQAKGIDVRSLEYWNDDGWVEDGHPVEPIEVTLDHQKIIGSNLVNGVRHKLYLTPQMSHFVVPLRASLRQFLGEADE